MFGRLFNGRLWQSQPTYIWETVFVALYLLGTTGFILYVSTIPVNTASEAFGQLLTAVALLLTFWHMTVATRLQEKQVQTQETVSCHRTLNYYLFCKEVAWVGAFLCLGAWNAILGVPIFLLYPVWRRVYLHFRASGQRRE